MPDASFLKPLGWPEARQGRLLDALTHYGGVVSAAVFETIATRSGRLDFAEVGRLRRFPLTLSLV